MSRVIFRVKGMQWNAVATSLQIYFFQAIYKLVGEKNVELITSDGLSAQQRVDRMFDVIDKDGDQQITVEEFRIAANMDPTLVILLQSPEN